MKYIINLIFLFFVENSVHAQLLDSLNNNVEFTYKGKITNKQKIVTNYIGTLLLNDTISAWGEEIAKTNKPVKNDSVNQILVYKPMSFIIFKNIAKNQIIFTQKAGFLEDKINVFSDTMDMFKWTLLKEQMTINNYKCKKAVCIHRGRKYEAWYTPEIPINNGPWKFGNLPGLIIEISSIDKYISWKMAGVKNTNRKVTQGLETNETFADYKLKINKGFKRYLQATGALQQVDPNCKSCQATKNVSIESTENVFD